MIPTSETVTAGGHSPGGRRFRFGRISRCARYVCGIALSFTALLAAAHAQQTGLSADIFSGHYASQANGERKSAAINHNIYIKLFENQWIVMMYVPLPYAETLSPEVITRAMENARSQTSSSAYLRGKFGHFSERATAHVEHFGYLNELLVFECGSLAPCTIRMDEGSLELIKPGMINEHIISYDHVVTE